MELHERLSTSRPIAPASGPDPFADVKNRIHLAVISELGPQLFNTTMEPAAMRDRVRDDIRTSLGDESGISRDDRERLIAEISDDILGHGPLERLLADDSVTEIMVNGPFDIWVERQGRLYETNVRFNDDSHLRRIINKMVAQVGRRIDESSPMVDARLPDGSRVNAIIPPLSLSGPLVTIRKFSRKRIDMLEMIKIGTLSDQTLRLEARPKNIEGAGEIAIRDLLRNSLRMRPDRIIVGEVRGAEALDMLQAMNTGHDGSLSTVHANAPRDALARIETMVLMAGFELPIRAIRHQVASALDLLVHLERLEDGSRRVTAITEVQRMESDVITLQELFAFKVERVTAERVVIGSLRPTGLRPTFLHKFEKRGVHMPNDVFAGEPLPDRTELSRAAVS